MYFVIHLNDFWYFCELFYLFLAPKMMKIKHGGAHGFRQMAQNHVNQQNWKNGSALCKRPLLSI